MAGEQVAAYLVHDTITEADMVHAMRAGGTNQEERPQEHVLRW